MKRTFLVSVIETYSAQIELQADSPEEAEEIADELVGGDKVSIIKLALSGAPGTNYRKRCEVCTDSFPA